MRIIEKISSRRDLLISIIIFLLVGIIILLANQTPIEKIMTRKGIYYEKAVVTEVISSNLEIDEESEALTGIQEIKAEIKSGELKGETFIIRNNANYMFNVVCEKGTKLIVSIEESGGERQAYVYTYDRTGALYGFIAVFCLVLIGIGGKKGVKSLLSLIFTFVCIIFLFIPLLYHGVSPIIASIILSIVSTFAAMVFIGGWNAKTISSIIGTIFCTSFAGATSMIAGHFLKISDFTMESVDDVLVIARLSNLNTKGILFAIILISSLGAIMDVCMSIASSINEVYMTNPKISQKDLFKSGINVGRDTMGTMSNTLILAFAGGFMINLIIIASRDITLYELLSMPSIVTEIIQGLAGSIGIFLAVPIVSLVSSWLTVNKKLL